MGDFWHHATALNSPFFYVLLAASFVLVLLALAQDFRDIIALFSAFWIW